jgi:hypothetical protein
MNGFLKRTVLLGVVLFSGCTFTSRPKIEIEEINAQPSSRSTDGVVEYAWEEPMVDVIDVPPGLDPEGIYYRPAHREVTEIRQGRWQYIREAAGR